MSIRGELFTTQVMLDNRAYFFNVKENRAGDVFLQIVESKRNEDAERHAIVVFAEDMKKFLHGMDNSLSFIEKDQRERRRLAAEKRAAKNASEEFPKKRVYRKKTSSNSDERLDDGIPRTGKLHVVSKRNV